MRSLFFFKKGPLLPGKLFADAFERSQARLEKVSYQIEIVALRAKVEHIVQGKFV
jgi:hypothetical protein